MTIRVVCDECDREAPAVYYAAGYGPQTTVAIPSGWECVTGSPGIEHLCPRCVARVPDWAREAALKGRP